MIKKYIILLVSSVLIFSSCLKEDPPFAMDKVYETEEGMKTAATGVFSGLAGHGNFSSEYWHLVNLHSGLIQSPRNIDIQTIDKLNVVPNATYNENVWAGHYQTINAANSFIDAVASKSNLNEVEHNELGQVYFVRSYLYLNLVRLWGRVPLKIGKTTAESLFAGRTDRGIIYEQIIADADSAKIHFAKANGLKTFGRPGTYAVNMLLAKVYMTLADADIEATDLEQDEVLPYLGLSSSECWTLAEKEALEVEASGEFSLVPDYASLWLEETRNSSESIFEIQFNVENAFNGKVWNIGKSYKGGAGWSRMGVTPIAVDEFVRANMVSDIDDASTDGKGKYTITAGDPRYASTFIDIYGIYPRTDNKKLYPNEVLKKKKNSVIAKYAIKNLESTTDATNQNMLIYRYGDLLLMLAEIENELDKPAEAIAYVNQVITRARTSENGDGVHPVDLTFTDKDAFRAEIFRQYRYELLGEGQDWFNNRRKGFDWFKLNTLDPHAAWPTRANANNNESLITFINDNKQKMMQLPIPLSEMNTNQEIDFVDQNPGY